MIRAQCFMILNSNSQEEKRHSGPLRSPAPPQERLAARTSGTSLRMTNGRLVSRNKPPILFSIFSALSAYGAPGGALFAYPLGRICHRIDLCLKVAQCLGRFLDARHVEETTAVIADRLRLPVERYRGAGGRQVGDRDCVVILEIEIVGLFQRVHEFPDLVGADRG